MTPRYGEDEEQTTDKSVVAQDGQRCGADVQTLSWLSGLEAVFTTRTNAEDRAVHGTVTGCGNRPNGTYASRFFEVVVMK